MGLLNRIVNVAVLTLAIISVVFGFLLFQKREQLVNRGDFMAASINKVAKELDLDSNTKYAENLLPAKLELDPKKSADAEKNSAKTLHHTNYLKLKSILTPFEKQAQDIKMQRDALGTALNDVSVKLENTESYTPAQFKDIKTYAEKKETILGFVEKVNARDNDIFAQIADSAGVIGLSFDKETLKSLENFKTPLGEFASKVEALKKRSDKYGEFIGRICGILDIQAPSLAGEDYESELKTAGNSIKGVKEEFDKTKTELARAKSELEKKTDELNKAVAEGERQKNEIAKLKKDLRVALGEEDAEPTAGKKENEDTLWKKLEGKVIELNPKWDFVVIDLGKSNKLMVGAKKKETTVELPEGKEMIVGRGDQFLGKIKIIRVNENCAIANIVPDKKDKAMGAGIAVGDRVFFSDVAVKKVTATPEKAEKAEKPEKGGKAEKAEKPEKAEKAEKAEEIETE